MKSAKSWHREQADLRKARILSEFANLESAKVEEFQRRHPTFLPESFWLSRAFDARQGVAYVPWQRERERLLKAWDASFPADKTLELVASAAFLIANTLAPQTSEVEQAPQIIWPYQRAVLFLHVHPTRARTCNVCGKKFVSETKAQFCSFGTMVDGIEQSCVWAFRKGYKKAKWGENKARVNADRRREYKSEKRSPIRAKRKNLRKG